MPTIGFLYCCDLISVWDPLLCKVQGITNAASSRTALAPTDRRGVGQKESVYSATRNWGFSMVTEHGTLEQFLPTFSLRLIEL